MTPPTLPNDRVGMSTADFEQLLTRAAERGARSALEQIGLGDERAARDVRELRSLLSCLRLAKSTAWQTFVKLLTTGVITLLIAGIAIKLKIFGGGQ